MRFLTLIPVLGLFVLSFSSFTRPSSAFVTLPVLDTAPAASSSIEDDILFYINRYRESKSLPALQMNAVICDQAEKHSEDMADKKTAFGHDGFEDRVRNMIQKLGSLHASAENVAYGQLTPEEVVALWIKSPGHRKNIEGNYTITGIGVAKAKDGSLYFTQIFSVK